jgi:hypothetical protein
MIPISLVIEFIYAFLTAHARWEDSSCKVTGNNQPGFLGKLEELI